ncbi:Protein kinase domain-containing protein [Cinnamomum micranthum f. kanehirae]|uniref:Protein kinase domain-containing protein n=1 Tax=Cinnamomum micranthum f. kanehirae TaxID=337451 RepID=A0A443N6F7_9MAGN|nr:Protein kinase domain-containing protein [Cinnamomum micranthum f. kanehirae]
MIISLWKGDSVACTKVVPVEAPESCAIDWSNMVYEGDAVPFDGDIRLNRVDYVTRVGRATYGEHMRVWDPSTQELTDFATNFSFIIDTQGKSEGNYGHGIVFFLTSVDSEIPPNTVGGSLGLLNTTSLLSPSRNNIIGVEFDSFSNPEWDPPGEHVGFIVNSLSSSQYVSWNATLHSLDVANAQVSYEASTQKLNLLLTYNTSPLRYSVSLDVDLRKILPEWVKIGFSAATGINTEIHRVLSWDFSSTLEGKEIIDANNTTNMLLVRRNKKAIQPLIIIVSVVGAVDVILALILVIWKGREKREEEKMTNPTPINVYEGDAVPFNGEIQLNRVDYITRVARATYSEHVRIWDPANGNLTDFTTKFSFIIDTLNNSLGGYGHGIVFFLAPVDSKIPPNSVGGFLGLFNTTTLLFPSKNNILGWDPPGEHVGFIINSLSSAEYVSWNASFHSLDVANAQVSYKASTKKMNLLLTYNDSPLRYNVSFDVDLRKILPEWVKIGFSAATGIVTETNRVLSWEFSSTLEGKETRNKHGNIKLMLGLVVPLGALGAVGFLIVWMDLKRRKKKEEEDQRDLLVYDGDAVAFNGEIHLNRVAQVGRATYGDHVHIWDPATRNLTDFTTNFSFIIDTQNKSVGIYGHGIVFFLAPVDSEIPPNSGNGYLGLFNASSLISPSQNKILGIEFDSFINPQWDPREEHVGFIVNSLSSSGYVSWNASMHSLDVANAQISYKASTKKLNLLLTYSGSPARYNVSLDVDLRTILPEWVKIGFSGATGINTEIHRVLSWEFSSTLEGNETIDATNSRHKKNIKLILGLAIPFGAVLFGLVLQASRKKREVEVDFDATQMQCLMIVGLWCAHPDHNLRPSIRQATQVLHFEASVPNLPNKMPVPMYMGSSSSAHSNHPSFTTSSIWTEGLHVDYLSLTIISKPFNTFWVVESTLFKPKLMYKRLEAMKFTLSSPDDLCVARGYRLDVRRARVLAAKLDSQGCLKGHGFTCQVGKTI